MSFGPRAIIDFFSRGWSDSKSSWPSFLDVAGSSFDSTAESAVSGAVVGVGAARDEDEAKVKAATRSVGANLTMIGLIRAKRGESKA